MRQRRFTRLFSIATVAVLGAVAMFTGAGPAAAAQRNEDEAIDYHEWSSQHAFGQGTMAGVCAGHDGLRISQPIGTIDRTEPKLGTHRTYEYGQWTSPAHAQGFDASELIASWNAATPAGTWLQVEASGTTETGEHTAWYVMGQWAEGDQDIHRTSVDGQSDANADVYTDTLAMKSGHLLRSYQLRVTLYREKGSTATPTVRLAGAMTSMVPDRFEVPISQPGKASGIELNVPRYAQNIHSGHYPEYGGGGEAWCSPTSTEMVTEFYGKRPSDEELSWLPADHPDRTVDNAARYTFDYAYDGTGNWPFNTAYAARFGLKAHVSRLHSLSDVEDSIARGFPVVVSVSFLASELDGAGYGTAGHLLVIAGFTKEGDVVANDPASSTDDRVRNVYKRGQFETIWQRTKRHDADGNVVGGPGGVAYLITP